MQDAGCHFEKTVCKLGRSVEELSKLTTQIRSFVKLIVLRKVDHIMKDN